MHRHLERRGAKGDSSSGLRLRHATDSLIALPNDKQQRHDPLEDIMNAPLLPTIRMVQSKRMLPPNPTRPINVYTLGINVITMNRVSRHGLCLSNSLVVEGRKVCCIISFSSPPQPHTLPSLGYTPFLWQTCVLSSGPEMAL